VEADGYKKDIEAYYDINEAIHVAPEKDSFDE